MPLKLRLPGVSEKFGNFPQICDRRLQSQDRTAFQAFARGWPAHDGSRPSREHDLTKFVAEKFSKSLNFLAASGVLLSVGFASRSANQCVSTIGRQIMKSTAFA